MGGLTKIGCEGVSTLKNWILYLFFVNLAKLFSCIILTVLSYVCITISEH